MEKKENVAVLGASKKKDRYAYMAIKLLKEYGHRVYPVHHVIQDIEGMPVYPNLEAIKDPIDTVTLYIGSARVDTFREGILQLKPKRVIFNPGTENEALMEALREANIEPVVACTLVMLKTNQF